MECFETRTIVPDVLDGGLADHDVCVRGDVWPEALDVTDDKLDGRVRR